MPQAVAAVATWYAGLSATAAFLVNIAISATLSVISSKLFGPKFDPIVQGLKEKQVTTRSALEYKKIVYGEAMLSGPIIYENLSGDDGEYFWYRIALTGHECDDLISVWLDGKEIPAADISWTAGAGSSDGTGTGAVSTGEFVGSNSTGAVNLWYYLGDPDQPVPGALNTEFTEITTNHRCRGDANFVIRMLYNEDTAEVWESGIPRDYKAVMRGRRLYDPRLDSTNGGSGSHLYTDDTTWEWSDNPALCVADYLVNYMGVPPATGIDWTSVADAADHCDATVAIPTATTETRFTCNGVLSEGEGHRDNLEALLSSFDGRLTHRSGVWYVRSSEWEAATVTLTDGDFVSDLDVRGSAPKAERYAMVRGNFVDPDRKYEPVEFEPVSDSSFATRDGGNTFERDLTLPCTNSNYMAQRIGFRLLEQSDRQIIVRGTVNEIGADIAPQTVVAYTSEACNWDAKTFRVIKWEPTGAGRYDIEMREDDSAAYDDPIEGDYTVIGGATITTPSFVVAAPSSLTATSVPSGIRLDWTNPATRLFETVEVYASSTSAWSGASLIAQGKFDTYTHNLDPGTARWYWVRTKLSSGQVSARNPDSDTSTVTATSGVDPIETPSVNEVTDGSDTFPAETQPHLESEGLDEQASYTAPSNIDTRCLVQWTGQAQISATTSGTAVGEARFRVRITVDAVTEYDKYVVLEGYRTSNELWAQLAGSITLAVPAGEEVIVYVQSFRDFSTSGSSPAQTHYWQNVLMSITPIREAVV